MAYCTLDDVRENLNLAATDTDDDSLISDLILAAQKMIERSTGRVFEADSDTTRYFDAIYDVSGDYLLWYDMDLCSITTITNGDAVVVASNEYVTLPANGSVFYGVKLLGSSGKTWTYDTDHENAISIEGRWAYSTTAPENIKRACIELATWYYKRREFTDDEPRVMPDEIMAMLAPEKRLV